MPIYRPLGLYRLVLALLVVFQHLGTSFAPQPIARLAFGLETGTLAVGVFFILSGFVIAEAVDLFYARRPVAFLTNRALRILPMFAAALALSVLAQLAFRQAFPGFLLYQEAQEPGRFAPREVMLNLLMPLDGLDLFRAYADHPFIVSAWTLRQEMFFYLVVFATLLVTRGGRRWVAAAVSCASILLFLVDRGWGWSSLSLQYAPFFLFGAAWYALVMSPAGRLAKTGLLLASGLCVAVQQFDRVGGAVSYQRMPMAQLVLLAVLVGTFCALSARRHDRRDVFRALDSRAGNLTFSLYLTHEIVVTGCALALGAATVPKFLAGMAASLLLALGFFLMIEPPLGRLRDRVRSLRTNPGSSASAGLGGGFSPVARGRADDAGQPDPCSVDPGRRIRNDA